MAIHYFFFFYVTEAASVLEITGMAAAQNGFVSRSKLARKGHVDAGWTGIRVHVTKAQTQNRPGDNAAWFFKEEALSCLGLDRLRWASIRQLLAKCSSQLVVKSAPVLLRSIVSCLFTQLGLNGTSWWEIFPNRDFFSDK